VCCFALILVSCGSGGGGEGGGGGNSGTPPGAYNLTITGKAGSVTHTAGVQLIVSP
jgi:hypothetical protein